MQHLFFLFKPDHTAEDRKQPVCQRLQRQRGRRPESFKTTGVTPDHWYLIIVLKDSVRSNSSFLYCVLVKSIRWSPRTWSVSGWSRPIVTSRGNWEREFWRDTLRSCPRISTRAGLTRIQTRSRPTSLRAETPVCSTTASSTEVCS